VPGSAATRLSVAAGLAVAAGLCAPALAGGATSVLYDTDAAVTQIVRGAPGQPGLGAVRGALRQEPSTRGVLGSRARVSKVSASELIGRNASEMAALLRQRIRSCVIRGRDYGCTSRLVFVDELTAAFNDRRGPRTASSLTAAMRMLNTASPYGGTWASRVHLYMAPNFTSAIAKGRGRQFNLGRDGKPHFPTWNRVMPALVLAGGVWLEMYHAAGGFRSFTAREWRFGPSRVRTLLTRAGGDAGRLHLIIAGVASPPAGARGCGGAMACQWKLAASGANRSIAANGVGAYRVGAQALAWLRGHNLHVG
jgi:hypothetical protein